MKRILVVAGRHEQYQRYVSEALQEDDRAVFTYLSDERALRGVVYDDVVFVGEWWHNETFRRFGRDQLFAFATRIPSRGYEENGIGDQYFEWQTDNIEPTRTVKLFSSTDLYQL